MSTATTKRALSATQDDPVDAILSLAGRGWHVFPCHSASRGECSCGKHPCRNPGKHPRTKHGLREATADKAQIRAWANQYRNCNWAAATGAHSGFFVLDVDGEKGRASLAALEKQHSELPGTLSCRTGREDGGEQHYFSYPTDLEIRSSVGKVEPGLDIRGEGGYVIIPPSVHRTGRTYEWLNPGAHIAPAPPWLLEVIRASRCPKKRISGPKFGILIEGERNDGLFRYGSARRRKGAAEAEIYEALLEANARRCCPPLEADEVRKIARSAARYPIGGPDPLEQAWETSEAETSFPGYERFLDLCRHLQLARPGLTIALPLIRIGELMDRNWTQVRRWRHRAVLEGRLLLEERYVPHRRAAHYVFRECSKRIENPKPRTAPVTAVPLGVTVPLTCTTSGLVGQSPQKKTLSGTPMVGPPSGTSLTNNDETLAYLEVWL